MHLFAPEQPDLNWENPSVVNEVHDIMEFWLDKGVDGFRMDVINFISKEPGLPDAPVSRPGQTYQDAVSLFCNGPRLHEHLRGLRKVLDRYGAFSVGEMPGVKEDSHVGKIVAADRKELHTIFQFDLYALRPSLPLLSLSHNHSYPFSPPCVSLLTVASQRGHRHWGPWEVFSPRLDIARL